MRRLALHLTCFIIGAALCALPHVDGRAESDAKATLQKSPTERPQLGLPAPQLQARTPLAPALLTSWPARPPCRTHVVVTVTRARVEPAPETSWRARAHPSQAPPV